MKKLFTLIASVVLISSVLAQSPEKMSYQAVVRDASDNLITSQSVGMQIHILQGSLSGTAVYVELHFPTTNNNGLITVEIGNGTIVSGDISTIDWTNGPYFIKTETDLNGGTNYTISGTSQLLSVPYALHAKTAETVTGTISETDPIYTSSQAANITATDITNLGNLSGTNTGDQDLSMLALKSNVLELDDTTAFTPDADYEPATKKYVDDNAPTTYSVGDVAHGGIVFWVDESGQHGLVCANEDQSTGASWTINDLRFEVFNAVRSGINGGLANTERIITQTGDWSYAAQLCAKYKGGNYGDWYLPSKYELNLLYLQKDVIGGFADWYYWSSTEFDYEFAWTWDFLGGLDWNLPKMATFYVRAVRAF